MYSIHPPLTRFETLDSVLTVKSWSEGFQNIFLRGVPFSARSNYHHARRLVLVLDSILSADMDGGKTINLLEVGAGHGILSKLVMDILKQDYLDRYDRAQLTLSDYSQSNLCFLETSNLLSEHVSHCRFVPLTDSSVSLISDCEYDLIYSSYLYSSFPCFSIEKRNGECFEILYESLLKSSTSFYNIDENDQFSTKNSLDFLEYYKGKHFEEWPLSLKSCLVEKVSSVGVSDSFPFDSLNLLKHLMDDMHDGIVNFSPSALLHIEELSNLLSERGVYVWSDVTGHIKEISEIGVLAQKKGGIHHYPVDIQTLCHSSHCYNSLFFTYSNEPVVDCCIKKSIFTETEELLLSEIFKDSGVDHFRDCFDHLNQLSNSYTENDLRCIYEKLPLIDRKDYYVLQLFLQKGLQFSNFAEELADLMIKTYHEFAIDAFRAKAFLAMSNHESPESYLNSILVICPDDVSSYELLGQYALQSKDYSKGLDLLRTAYLKETQSTFLSIEKLKSIQDLIQMVKMLTSRF